MLYYKSHDSLSETHLNHPIYVDPKPLATVIKNIYFSVKIIAIYL